MDALLNPEIWIALATLTALELVLGIDNIIFISILAGRLPPHQRSKARRVGIAVAAISRLERAMRSGSSHLISAWKSARKKKLSTPASWLALIAGRIAPT